MASRVSPDIGRQILELVRKNGGTLRARDMRDFKRQVGATCSMNVFKKEVDHQTRPGGKLMMSRPRVDDPHVVDGSRDLVIRLRKLSS